MLLLHFAGCNIGNTASRACALLRTTSHLWSSSVYKILEINTNRLLIYHQRSDVQLDRLVELICIISYRPTNHTASLIACCTMTIICRIVVWRFFRLSENLNNFRFEIRCSVSAPLDSRRLWSERDTTLQHPLPQPDYRSRTVTGLGKRLILTMSICIIFSINFICE